MGCNTDAMGNIRPETCTHKREVSKDDILEVGNNLFKVEAIRNAEKEEQKDLPSDSDFDKGYTINLTATGKDIIVPNMPTQPTMPTQPIQSTTPGVEETGGTGTGGGSGTPVIETGGR